MYKKKMNGVYPEVHSKVCDLLARDDRELVHISHESMLEHDDRFYCLIAVEENPENGSGYSVHCYDDAEKNLFRGIYSLTYPEALIEMGSRIKE